MQVPVIDLQQQFLSLRDELVAAVTAVLDSGRYALGPAVERFEREFAAAAGAEDCIAVESGTAALILALLAHGIGPGDEVITVSQTFIATAEAISWAGAKPVFADIDPRTHTMDPAALPGLLSSRTRAVIPVHLYGQPAEMDAIAQFAREHGLAVIQDAAQAHGALYRGKPLGALGSTVCYSFYPTKNLGSCGEGGAIATSDPEIAAACRALRDHGQAVKNRHDRIGLNARMQGVQGAVLSVKLPHLERWTEQRRQVAAWYDELLADSGVETPYRAPTGRHVFHLYVVRSPRRDALRAHLAERGVGTAIHYPVPIHRQPCYEELGMGEGSLPETERACREVLSLPMYPELTREAVEYVAEAVRSFPS